MCSGATLAGNVVVRVWSAHILSHTLYTHTTYLYYEHFLWDGWLYYLLFVNFIHIPIYIYERNNIVLHIFVMDLIFCHINLHYDVINVGEHKIMAVNITCSDATIFFIQVFFNHFQIQYFTRFFIKYKALRLKIDL